ncbi:MAG TPA: HEAT repeat domain-containing protein [Cyclobacteriaceae bacterium]|nr:HEAT repeat domain-containing protein [Cyclobacteriaceae bacterium]
MKSFFAKLLSLQEGEGSRVTSLLTMGFLMGMFLATITVASSALFLANFDEETTLPKAFLLSGVIGLSATISYNLLQNRIPFTVLGGLSIVMILGLTALLEFGPSFIADTKDLYFAGFTLILPFTYILNLVFWGSFARLFNTRQSKRLLGTVDAGAMIASFVAYFSIPQILKAVESESALYTISLISISLFILLFLYLSSRHVHKAGNFTDERQYYRKVSPLQFLRNRYMLNMSAFVVVSMLVVTFVDYSFLNVTTIMLPEKDIARFISYFGMTVVVFNLLFQSFATPAIVKHYGMRVAMLINPVLIGIFTLAAIGVGYTTGHSRGSELFVVFFISIAMSKLFIESLRDALDTQTFRLYLLPLEHNIRIDVQTKVEGVVMALATVLAGALIILLNSIRVFDFFSVTVATIPLVGAWYYISNTLNKGYKTTLRNTLAFGRVPSGHHREHSYNVPDVLQKGIESDVDGRVMYALRLMEQVEPALFENAVVTLAGNGSPRIRQFLEERVQPDRMVESRRGEIHNLANRAADHVEDSDHIGITLERLIQLGNSRNRDDRLIAARTLSTTYGNKAVFLLLELLRDPDAEVKYAALRTARKIRRPETWPVLIELLRHPAFSHHAAAALQQAGESILPTLEAAFNKNAQSDITMLRIVQIMGRIGGEYALKLLLRKAEHPDKRIVRQILHALRYRNYRAKGREALEINNMLDNEIGKTIWNLAARHELPDEHPYQHLRAALQEEIEANYNHITLLLSLRYDPQSVRMVKDNIDSGDPDSIAFALELMETFIDPGLKARLFPLFDDTSVPEKLQALQLFYPRETYTPIQAINYILNRDYNEINRWTKACAIHATAFLPDFRISRGLIAHVFNPDKLLQETAAWVIWRKNRTVYETVVGRLRDADRKYLHSTLEENQLGDGLNDGAFLEIERILFLKSLPGFTHVSGLQLSELAGYMTTVALNAGASQDLTSQPDSPVLVAAHGAVQLYLADGSQVMLQRGEVYGDVFQEEAVRPVQRMEATERAIVFRISSADFYFVMVNNPEFMEGMIRNIAPAQGETAEEKHIR